jgi:hypothetical protein
MACELVTREKIRELRKQLLEYVLTVVWRLRHGHQVIFAAQEKDAAAH